MGLIVIIMLIIMLTKVDCYMLNTRCQLKQIISTSSTLSTSSNYQMLLKRKTMFLNARKIIGRDNLGDPIYDDEVNTSEGISVLGIF